MLVGILLGENVAGLVECEGVGLMDRVAISGLVVGLSVGDGEGVTVGELLGEVVGGPVERGFDGNRGASGVGDGGGGKFEGQRGMLVVGVAVGDGVGIVDGIAFGIGVLGTFELVLVW